MTRTLAEWSGQHIFLDVQEEEDCYLIPPSVRQILRPLPELLHAYRRTGYLRPSDGAPAARINAVALLGCIPPPLAEKIRGGQPLGSLFSAWGGQRHTTTADMVDETDDVGDICINMTAVVSFGMRRIAYVTEHVYAEFAQNPHERKQTFSGLRHIA